MVMKGKEVRIGDIGALETHVQEMKDRADYIRESAAELFASISEVLEQEGGHSLGGPSGVPPAPGGAHRFQTADERERLTIVK